ncbi:MAG: hypothetical protein K2X49_19645 [Acetobacteraceae bacterium]|nr:hypothetical protein [Acetobacteraceae bacterium]
MDDTVAREREEVVQISSVRLLNEGEPLATAFDEERLRRDYPDVLERFDDGPLDADELREAVGETWRHYLLEDAFAEVNLDDGSATTLRTSDIIDWNGSCCDVSVSRTPRVVGCAERV